MFKAKIGKTKKVNGRDPMTYPYLNGAELSNQFEEPHAYHSQSRLSRKLSETPADKAAGALW